MDSFAKSHAVFRCSIILLFAAVTSAHSEEKFRTFTNKQGVQIAAEFLDFADQQTVRIKRISDGMEFSLNISDLGLEDQMYLASEWKKRAAAAESDSKGTLLATMPDPADRLFPVSNIGRWENTTVGARTAQVTALGNTWLCYWSREFEVRILIPYYGETSWKIETGDRGTVWLTRGGGEKELVGLHLEQGQDSENQARVAAIDPKLVRSSLCLSSIDPAELSVIDSLAPDLPLAIAVTRKYTPESLAKLAERKVLALHGDVARQDLPVLEKFSGLDFLFLKVAALGLQDVLQLPRLPNLKHLALRDAAGQVEWDKALASMPNLRSLILTRVAKDTSSPGTPITTFAANPALSMLVANNRSGNYLSLDALKTAPGLRYLRLTAGDIGGKKEDYSPIFALRNLEYYNVVFDNIPMEELDSWFVSGAMENLRDYTGIQVPLCQFCPALESVYLMRSESLEADRDFARLQEAPASLDRLRLNWVHFTNARKMNFVAPENLRSFDSGSTTFPDPEFLYRFRNLTRLAVSGDNGGIVDLNIGQFPNLTSLHLAKIEDLTSVDGLTGHPNLAVISIHNHPLLTNLGTAQQNTSMHTINISGLQQIDDLDTFSKVTGCKRLFVNNCDLLASYETIKTNNTLEQVDVKNCDKLPDFSQKLD